MAEREEGWYTDPFGRHEARSMSDGNSIKLVRDDGVESYDAPPEEPSKTPEVVREEQLADAQDLLRAGDSDSSGGSLKERMSDAGQFGATWGSHVAMPDIRGDE